MTKSKELQLNNRIRKVAEYAAYNSELAAASISVTLSFPSQYETKSEGGKEFSVTQMPKSMPDISKIIGFNAMKYIRRERVKVYGLLNVSAVLGKSDVKGEVTLAYRSQNMNMVPVPQISVAIAQPSGLTEKRAFGAEGSSAYDLTLVPPGADLYICIEKRTGTPNETVKVAGIDLFLFTKYTA